ncbi:MFS transporter [Paracidobacterium acidisoli]|uniref:MFS transporter n=1 Tax=Paracidobacterium acidisoli TaxID=2303751 RepID=A0A372IL13_9BACT|nr:MFS transporter [Paracidobacterium acidisoli]MBT9332623.1 MFS transporter [Paracidobacterium acidisoli]
MSTPAKTRAFLGMPVILLGGYLAIVFCMTGDGIEQAFLSKYLVTIGFSGRDASLVFTVYGGMAALASWVSGVLADVISPKKVMLFGIAWWLIFHALFLHYGLAQHSLSRTLIFYGLRGLAYPLFFYAFFVWVVEATPGNRLASAIGWVWAMFTIGYGIVGSYLPSFTIGRIGFMGTLWMSMIWIFIGGLIVLFATREPAQAVVSRGAAEKLREMSKGLTLIFQNRNIALALIIRIICNLSLFGFPVIMPLYYTSREIGFTTTQWLQIWGTFFLIQPFTNVMWGVIGDRIGWMRQMRWVGFVGCGAASLGFYFFPAWFPHNFFIAFLAAIFFALTITSFVPMGAIFPMIEPNHKGAAISVQNLGGGLSNFFGPAIATLLLPAYGFKGIVIVYGALYFIAAVMTLWIKVDQPRHTSLPEYVAMSKGGSAAH